jgi:AhpD family alkylhydroperoxidase
MSGHNHHQDVLDDLNPQGRALRQMIPEVYRGFGMMSTAVLSPGALDSKIKELMALIIGVVDRCDGCIAAHARGAVLAGASKEEAAEAIGVSFLMQGGPATVYGARAYDAFCEFFAAAHANTTTSRWPGEHHSGSRGPLIGVSSDDTGSPKGKSGIS